MSTILGHILDNFERSFESLGKSYTQLCEFIYHKHVDTYSGNL